jgi:hypothetical protein
MALKCKGIVFIFFFSLCIVFIFFLHSFTFEKERSAVDFSLGGGGEQKNNWKSPVFYNS